jgi:hypothetical protein
MQALYQLSYNPVHGVLAITPPAGFEPDLRFSDVLSITLRAGFEPDCRPSARRELNPRNQVGSLVPLPFGHERIV